jgi:ribosomal protein S18 acetylase RimI-like enzyme
MHIGNDSWLSEIFEYPVFKIDAGGLADPPSDDTRELRELVSDHQRAQDKAFYYAKVDTKQVDVARALSSAGLYVVDVNVTFSIEAPSSSQNRAVDLPQDVVVHEIQPAEEKATLDIAGSCFRYSRFHLDPLVSTQIANRIKRDWIFNYIKGKRGDRLFVALTDGRPAGFLAAIATGGDGERAYVIDLVGVGSGFQRRGIGQALTSFFISYYRNSPRLEVGTQAANIPSMRLYEKCGFGISKTQYVMHGHVANKDSATR